MPTLKSRHSFPPSPGCSNIAHSACGCSLISGFVIPYAMYSINYRISDDAWPFLLRRIVRLEPAYIASVFVAFALTFAATRTPGYGEPPVPSLSGFLLQFLYLCQWFDVPWLIDPAWSLAIEFQFYLFMLIAAPLLLSRSMPVKLSFFAAMLRDVAPPPR
jgi:peptidoglycan/LPS O-acetylase OafA/YrhL